MQTLSSPQTERAAGGLLWTTPAMVALADSACVGPLGAAFGAGFAIGTFIYQTWLND